MMCNSLFYNSNNKNKQETCASKIRNQHVISRKRERKMKNSLLSFSSSCCCVSYSSHLCACFISQHLMLTVLSFAFDCLVNSYHFLSLSFALFLFSSITTTRTFFFSLFLSLSRSDIYNNQNVERRARTKEKQIKLHQYTR